MNEAGESHPSENTSAGALLRAARQAQGLHIAALATTLKVPPRKLEALEADRYDEFQGATFVRALAQAACRALKIDPTPVLDRLPDIDSGNLSQLERGLNAPFRERGARRDVPEVPGASLTAVGLVVVLLLGAVAFWLLPAGWRPSGADKPAVVDGTAPPAAAGEQPSPVLVPAPGPQPQPLPPATTDLPLLAPSSPRPAASSPSPVPTAPSGALSALPPNASVAPASTSGSVLQLRANKASWVEVVDGSARVLLARTLTAGEVVGLDGPLPLRVKIGNVSGTELSFRGQPVSLPDANGDNVARLELK